MSREVLEENVEERGRRYKSDVICDGGVCRNLDGIDIVGDLNEFRNETTKFPQDGEVGIDMKSGFDLSDAGDSSDGGTTEEKLYGIEPHRREADKLNRRSNQRLGFITVPNVDDHVQVEMLNETFQPRKTRRIHKDLSFVGTLLKPSLVHQHEKVIVIPCTHRYARR